jgi:hypothetical protein
MMRRGRRKMETHILRQCDHYPGYEHTGKTEFHFNLDTILYFLQLGIENAGSQKEYANSLGISPAYLNDVIQGRREPGEKILRAIGLEKRVSYVKVMALERKEKENGI